MCVAYGHCMVCVVWGGIAVGIFSTERLGGLGGVSLISQLIGTVAVNVVAMLAGSLVYGVLKIIVGIRLNREDEYRGADLSIHRASASPGYDS